MVIHSFEDIVAWQKSRELTVEIYDIFKDSKDFSLKDQVQRASVSIMNNIAEGFERKSNKEFRHFLFIAKGSCAEVRSMLHLIEDLGLLTAEKTNKLMTMAIEVSRMLSGLIKKL